MQVVSRVLAIGLALVVSQPVAVAAQDEPPSPEELEALAAEFECPALEGLELGSTEARTTESESTVTCRYTVDGASTGASVEVNWQPVGVQDAYLCLRNSATTDDAQFTNITGTVRLEGFAVTGTFNFFRDRPGPPTSAWESAAAELAAQAADRGAPCPPSVGCTPVVGGLSVAFETEADVRTSDGVWQANCWWIAGAGSDVPAEDHGSWSDVVMNVWFATPGQDGARVTTVCSAEPFDDRGMVIIPGPDAKAMYARIDFRSPGLRFPREEMIAEANRLLAEIAPIARSCDGVEIISMSDYYTPLPAWLDIDPDLATGGSPIDIDMSGAGSNAPVPGDNGIPVGSAPAPFPGSNDSGGKAGALLSILGVVMLVLSILGIVLSLVLVGRESRLRPLFDIARVVVMSAVAAAMTFLFATKTPMWAFAAAVVAGLGLGVLQGRNLTVRPTAKGLYAKRTTVAVLAFVAGLVITQVAGLANRAGGVQLGLALSVLSVATAIGLILGRHPAVGEARKLGTLAAALALMAPLVTSLVFDTDRAAAQDDQPAEPTSQPGDIFLDMVEWDTVEIIGGYRASDAKPAIPFPVLDDYTMPPAPLTVDHRWDEINEFDSTTFTFDVEEGYSFALTTAGVCCDVTYTVSGTATTAREGSDTVTQDISGTAVIPDLVVGAGNLGPVPFGQATIIGDTCSRTIVGPREGGDLTQFDTFTSDGTESFENLTTPKLWIGCDIPGFTVADALAQAPPTPPRTDPDRSEAVFGTAKVGCPVYQEAVAAVYDPAFEEGKLNPDQLGRLFLTPNAPACQGQVDLGGDERGATRSELSFDLASTDPIAEARRRWDKWDSFLNERPLHEIAEDDLCVLDEMGVPQNPDTTDACLHRSYHQVAEGVITIWVDRAVADGPNTWVRGFFPWGDYNYRCHHCEPGSPEIARVLDRWHSFGSRGVGGYDSIDITVEVLEGTPDGTGGEDDGGEGAGDPGDAVDDELIDLFAGDDADDETRAAVAAALAGLLGAVGLAGISMAESATSAAELLDALRSGDLDQLRPDELPTDEEIAALFDDPRAAEQFAEELRRRQAAAGLAAGGVLDEHGNVIRPGDDGLFDWDTPDGTERLPRAEILERIAAAREANAARDAHHDAIVADGWDEEAIARRQSELTQRSIDDDARAAAELADHLAHEAAQDETRQRVADALQERAEAGGWDAIADRLERGDALTREELQALRDALDRLTAEQGAFDPADSGTYAEDLWNEFAADAATAQEAMARVAETVYGPAAGWIVRNPGTTARIGLGIATGGFSEGVIAPHEMMAAMEEAAARAHAEGRDLTYSEAMLAAAWHAGPGMLMGKAAELGIAAAGPTIARWGSEALERMGRSLDEFFDNARGGVDVPVPRSVRSAAELAEDHGLRWNPDGAAGGVRSMEPGTIVPQSRISQDYGMTPDGYRQLRGAVQRNDVAVSVRSRSQGAMNRINAGAVPKPAPIKIKTGGELDEFIGMSPGQRDLVPWKPDGDWIPPVRDTPPPNWPPNRAWDDDAYDAVMGRYTQRRQEWLDNRDTMNELFSSNQARHNPETGNLEWNTTGGRRADPDDFRPVAGDHDIFDIEVNVPQSVLDMGPEEVERYVRQVQADVIQDLSGPPLNVQHAAHMQWSVPSTRQAQGINARILDSHRPPAPGGSGDALLRVARDMPAHISYYEGASLTLDEVHRIFR